MLLICHSFMSVCVYIQLFVLNDWRLPSAACVTRKLSHSLSLPTVLSMVTRHEINTVRSAADRDTVKKKHSFEQTALYLSPLKHIAWLIDRSNRKLRLRSVKLIISVSLEHYCYCQILGNWQSNMI